MSADLEHELFDACVVLADAAARETLLARCPDPRIAERVRRLLAAHDAAPSFEPAGFAELPRLAVPARIGPYRIVERIGEGGMGEVYLARQDEPVRREVALKILKFGLGSREVLARFDLERQTLALMSHPAVARILDAGTTEDGRPYFAMEYVPGIALTRWCDERRLDVAGRLVLFAEVCAGVQHAHLRGVIHRDLKPSNILVTEVDGRPLPKVIDFGIAKATTAAGDGDGYTRIGHLLGTPEYMSPEQVELSPLDIDARTDVYSLGVILYELLTGARPYAVTRDAVDAQRLAREIAAGDVVPPSRRALDGAADAVDRAAARATTPRQLAAELRGELDWIVQKAMDRDRQRRYTSPAELAADLARRDASEPVVAGPPSAAYRIGRFARRHRVAVGVAGALFAAALAFGGGMAVLAGRAAAERDRANDEAETSRRVTIFTAGLFELANPETLGRDDVSARELLEAGVRRMEAESRMDRPDVRAALYESAGNAYRGLGNYEAAAPLLERAVALRRQAGENREALATALRSQALLASAQGDYARAEVLLRQSLAAYGASAGEGAGGDGTVFELAETLRLLNRLDEAAEVALHRRKTCETRRPRDDACIARATMEFGRVLAAQGHLDDAVKEHERSLAMHRTLYGNDSVGSLSAKNAFADALVTRGESTSAEPLLREIVADSRRIYGDWHPTLGIALSNLGNALSDQTDKLQEAERVYLEALAILRSRGGRVQPEYATTLNNLGFVYSRTQQWRKARAVYAESAAIRERVLGARHPDTAAAHMGEALALNKLGEFAAAERLLRRAIETFTSELGADHWRTANAQRYLGTVLTNQRRFDDAERELRAAHDKLTRALGADHPRTQSAATALAELAAARRESPQVTAAAGTR